MRRGLLATLASTLFAVPALGADLSGASYYAPPPVFTWTGAYVGANASFGFGAYSNTGNNYFGSADGGLFGVTAGYNYQSGPLVAGIEGDVDFGDINGTGTPRAGVYGSGSLTGEGSVRARFGYAFNQALVYVTGGYTGANLRGSVADFSAPPNLYVSQSTYLNGFVLGGGIEYAMTHNISVKAEYLFSDYGASGLFSGTRDAMNSGLSMSTIRAGIDYHF